MAKNTSRELPPMGALQQQANAVRDASEAERQASEGRYHAISRAELEDEQWDDITIPDAMRDGTFWTFLHVGEGKRQETEEFYDYRYRATYCRLCNRQYRWPVCHLVRCIGPERWQVLWTCPHGHTHDTIRGDVSIRELLCRMHRDWLIEDGKLAQHKEGGE